MNQLIQEIADKVNDNIAAKAIATPDPAKITAADQAEILNSILEAIDPLVSDSLIYEAAGLSWFLAPTFDINGNEIDISYAEMVANGVIKQMQPETLTITLPASGYQTPYTIVTNPNAETGNYELIPGDTVALNASFAFPPVLANRLWVGNFMASGAGIFQLPSTPIKSIQVNSGTKTLPDARGNVNLTIPIQGFTPITANQYGTHPAFNSQNELNAFLLGGVYTAPSTPPVSGASASPTSDTAIKLTWSNPS
jgi:hypothetical protein